MSAQNRLNMILSSIVAGAVHSVLIALDEKLARDVAIGYVVMILTVFVVDFWSRHRE